MTEKEQNSNETSDEISTDDLKQHIMNLQKENEELKDQYLRSVAEAQNLRNRAEKQTEEMAKYAVSNFAKELLNVSDNFQRALENAPKSEDEIIKNFVIGVEMTQKELLNAFKKFNISKIVPNEGDDFDYNLHQAVARVPSENVESGKIVDVMQIGYKIHDRLLRPAMVAVSE